MNRQTDVACTQHRPQCDGKYDDRQQDEDQHRPNRRDTTGSAPHEQRENCSTYRADEKLAGNCRSNTKLLEMIVTPDLAHERKKRTRRNEHGKAIADDHERCRDAERREQQHRRCHHDCGHESGQQPGENRFCFAHCGEYEL